MRSLSSATGLISLLKEDDEGLQSSAITSLLQRVDEHWNEISESLEVIETLYESPEFKMRQHAALLLSKTYYHLGEYHDAFVFALGAGKMFDVRKQDQFTHTIVQKCIDRYIELRQLPEAEMKADKQYVQLDELFSSLFGAWTEADKSFTVITEHIGLCIATQRLDLLEKVADSYIKETHSADVLTCILRFANQHVGDVDVRENILRRVVKLYAEGPEKLRSMNYFDMQQCLLFLNDHEAVCRNLSLLLDSNSTQGNLIAYQLGFDLVEHCNQDFLQAVTEGLKARIQQSGADPVPENYANLRKILTGVPTIELQFQFLYSQNCASTSTMQQLKQRIDQRQNAITHNAALMANAIMFCGTTCDKFLRDNLDWMSKAKHWACFTSTAALGVINKGHVTQSMQVLQRYLPSAPGSSGESPYQEGGALFGLGLIHAPVGCNLRDDSELVGGGDSGERTQPKEALNFLLECVRANKQSEKLIHGACLGIGLAAMSSKDAAVYDLLSTVLYNDNAVSGEAAAVAIGLLYLGSGEAKVVDELLAYGKDTLHEKIIRGVSMALAMTMYGREGHADALIEDMLLSTDPWLRMGGVQVIGSAYAGTGNRKAIERLLTVAVQDTSDDVRRAGILEVGFVGFKEPNVCVNILSVFADSHSPHIRWGVAAALGVAAAGTANKQALDRLWTLKDDSSDFVRQGALVSIAMVLMQRTEKEVPRVKEFREELDKRIGDKYEEILTRFGAVLAVGILDAGGKNQTVCLQRNGHNLVKPIVGLHMFMQYWYWYPFVLMFSLALQPTCIIALNKSLKMPTFEIRSNAPPSLYGVPKKQEESEGKDHKKRAKVVLSTTTKAQRRSKMKKGEEATPAEEKLEPEKGDDKEEKDEKRREEEPSFEMLQNPARVTNGQMQVLALSRASRYTPIKPGVPMGILMVSDNKPDEEEQLVPVVNPRDVNVSPDEKNEPPPPEPFEWP